MKVPYCEITPILSLISTPSTTLFKNLDEFIKISLTFISNFFQIVILSIILFVAEGQLLSLFTFEWIKFPDNIDQFFPSPQIKNT